MFSTITSSTWLPVLTSLPSSINLSGDTLSALNKLLIVLPFLPHTQHWNGLNPFLFSVKLTSSFGLW